MTKKLSAPVYISTIYNQLLNWSLFIKCLWDRADKLSECYNSFQYEMKNYHLLKIFVLSENNTRAIILYCVIIHMQAESMSQDIGQNTITITTMKHRK